MGKKMVRYVYIMVRKSIYSMIRSICRELSSDPMERYWCVAKSIENCYHVVDLPYFDEFLLRRCVEDTFNRYRKYAVR